MYEQYAIVDDAASIVSDATILADRYDAVMADTDFQESRSVNIYTDLHPVNVLSIYDEDVATFIRSSLMQDQEEDCGEEDEENDDKSKAKVSGDAVSTSGSSSSTPSQDPRERAARFSHTIQEVEKSQLKVLRWRTVLGRHEAFDISRPPPVSQQGSLLRLCSSSWQPPPRPEYTKETFGTNLASRADEVKQAVPIPTISWTAGHVDGHDDDSSISFNINFSILSDKSVASDMDCNEEEHDNYSFDSTLTEEMPMLLDQFIEFEGNGDYEDNNGSESPRLLHTPFFVLSFGLGAGESPDATISGDGDSCSISESNSTAGSICESQTMSESPSESVAEESVGTASSSNGLESSESFSTSSKTECSGQSSTLDTVTIKSSTISQRDECDEGANSETNEDNEKSTLSEADSFSSNSSTSASTTSEVISPMESFLGTLTCGAMGTREVNDVFDEEMIEDRESALSSSTSHYSDGAVPLLGNEVDEKSRASDKYSPAANFDDFHTFAGEMERGVEVDIDSFVRSNLLGNDFAETQIKQSNSDETFRGNHQSKKGSLEALYPEVVNALRMHISLYACRRTNVNGLVPKKLDDVMTNSPGTSECGACEENTTKKNDEAIDNIVPTTFAAAVRGALSRLSLEARETRVIGEGPPKMGKREGALDRFLAS